LRIFLGAWKIFYEKIFTLFSNESLFLSTAMPRGCCQKAAICTLCFSIEWRARKTLRPLNIICSVEFKIMRTGELRTALTYVYETISTTLDIVEWCLLFNPTVYFLQPCTVERDPIRLVRNVLEIVCRKLRKIKFSKVFGKHVLENYSSINSNSYTE